MRYVAITAFIALTGFLVFLYHSEKGETESSRAPEVAPRIESSPALLSTTFTRAPDKDATAESGLGLSPEPNASPGESVSAPVASPLLMQSAEAAFAEEHDDPEWSSRMWRAIINTINGIEGGVSRAEVNCRSSTCRVELVWGRPVTDENQYLETIAAWEREVLAMGEFRSGKTEFFPESATSLSYFSTNGITSLSSSGLPPGLPPEVAESLRQSLLEGAEEIRRQAVEVKTTTSHGSE